MDGEKTIKEMTRKVGSMTPLPPADDLRERFQYDPEAGVIRHKINPRGKGKLGGIAGTIDKDGYVVLTINERKFRAHRVIWKMMTGMDPTQIIDHANGIPGDNRWVNLREATFAQNSANARVQRDSTSGLKGARVNGARWTAMICKEGNSRYLGSFGTPEEAHAVYAEEAQRVFNTFARAK